MNNMKIIDITKDTPPEPEIIIYFEYFLEDQMNEIYKAKCSCCGNSLPTHNKTNEEMTMKILVNVCPECDMTNIIVFLGGGIRRWLDEDAKNCRDYISYRDQGK